MEPVITLEASIWYYTNQLAAENAAAAIPCARLVWILRNPLPHARSLYFHMLQTSQRRLAGKISMRAIRYECLTSRTSFQLLSHLGSLFGISTTLGLDNRPLSAAVPNTGLEKKFSFADVLEPELTAMERCTESSASARKETGFGALFLKCMQAADVSIRSVSGSVGGTLLTSGLYHFYIEVRWPACGCLRAVFF